MDIGNIENYSFIHGLHRNMVNGKWFPLHPHTLGRALTHPEMDYNLLYSQQTLAGWRIFGQNNDLTLADNELTKSLIFWKISVLDTDYARYVAAGYSAGQYIWITPQYDCNDFYVGSASKTDAIDNCGGFIITLASTTNATQIPDPTATPVPTATATPVPRLEPTATPIQPTPTTYSSGSGGGAGIPDPAATPDQSIKPEPTATPDQSIRPEPTATPDQSIRPEPTATPVPTLVPTATPVPEPTSTEVPGPTDLPDSSGNAPTPDYKEPTATPRDERPSPTPSDAICEEYMLVGDRQTECVYLDCNGLQAVVTFIEGDPIVFCAIKILEFTNGIAPRLTGETCK